MTNEELVKEIQSGHDVQNNMGLLYKQNLGLIKRFVLSVLPQGYIEIEVDDLMQEAYFGLMDAVMKYIPGETTFMTYAEYWIKGKARKYIYKQYALVTVSERVLGRVARINRFCEEYQKNNGRVPSDDEICKGVNITRYKYQMAIKAKNALEYWCLDMPLCDEDDGCSNVGDYIPDDKNIVDELVNSLAQQKVKTDLWEAVDSLPSLQQQIIQSRFVQDNSQVQAAKKLYIDRNKLRRQECIALKRLRAKKNIAVIAEAYSVAYHGSAKKFAETWTSSTEEAAIKLAE